MLKARWLSMIALMAFMPVSHATIYIGPGALYQTTNVTGARYDDIAPKLTVGISASLPCPLSPLYAGFEGFYIPTTVNLTNSISNIPGTSVNLKTNYSVGVAALLGFNLDKVIKPYGRVGVLSTYFSTVKQNRSAWQVGLGIDVKVAEFWGARGEYNYNVYQSIQGAQPKTQELGISIFYLIG